MAWRWGSFLFGSNPEGIVLFIVISILISLSLIPILIAVTTSPQIHRPALLGLRELFKLSPMGVTGSFLNGIAQSALYVGLGLYGAGRGLSASQTGTLVAAVTVGGMLLQFPIGRLSDTIDRRRVIVGCSAVAVPICALLILQPTASTDLGWTLVLIASLGGLCLPIYSLCLAHTNDYLTPEEIVPAGSTLIMVFYIGLIIGPTLVAMFVDRLGSAGLFSLHPARSGIDNPHRPVPSDNRARSCRGARHRARLQRVEHDRRKPIEPGRRTALGDTRGSTRAVRSVRCGEAVPAATSRPTRCAVSPSRGTIPRSGLPRELRASKR